MKPQCENFTMHCLGLDQEFQLAKIPVQTLGGTPDGDLAGALRAAVDLDAAATPCSLPFASMYLSWSPSPVPCTATPPNIIGGTTLASTTKSPKGKGSNRATHLPPALYALGQHHALAQAATHLRDGELLAAYLDDVYIVCPPERAADPYTALMRSIAAHAGVAANQGKTRVYNRLGGPPASWHSRAGHRRLVWVPNPRKPTAWSH